MSESSIFRTITEWIIEATEKPAKNLPDTPEPFDDDDNPVKQKLTDLLAKVNEVEAAANAVDWVIAINAWRAVLIQLAIIQYKVESGDPDTHGDAVEFALDGMLVRLLQSKAPRLAAGLGAAGVISSEPDPLHEGLTRHQFHFHKLIGLITDRGSAFGAPDRPSAIAYGGVNGTWLAHSSGDYQVRIWNLDGSTSVPIKTLRGHPGRINAVAFNGNGTRVASASEDHSVRIWDAAPTGSPDALHVLNGHRKSVWSVAFDGNDRLASGSADRTVRTWTSNGGEGHTLRGHEDDVLCVAFNGSRIVSASADRTLRIWNADTGGAAIRVLRGHSNPVRSVAFNPTGTRVVSAGDDSTIRIWNVADGVQQALIEGHDGRVLSVAFSSDGLRIVSAGEDQTVRVWDASSGNPMGVLEGHQSRVWSAAFRPGAPEVASASQDKLVLSWHTTSTSGPKKIFGTAEDVIGQPLGVTAALTAMAPTLGASVLAGDLTVADLEPPLASDPVTAWGQFRQAAGQWLSATIPEIKTPGTGPRPDPASIFEIRSEHEPDESTTWAVRANHYASANGGVRDFETWFLFTPEREAWEFALYSERHRLYVKPAITFGFGYDGGARRWHGAIEPVQGSPWAPATPDDPVVVRFERETDGGPDILLSPTEGMRLKVQDIRASLAVWDTDALAAQAGDPAADVNAFEARARIEGFNFHIDPLVFKRIPLIGKYLAGKKGDRFRYGLDVDLEAEVTYSPRDGVRVNADGGLDTLYVVNVGPDWLKLHSVRLRADLNAIANAIEGRVLLTTHLSSKVQLGGVGFGLVLDGFGTWAGSMIRRDDDGAIRLDENGVPERWHWGLILPSGLGLEIIGDVVRGGGYLYRTDLLQAALPDRWIFADDPVFPNEERYAGLLHLKIRDLEAIAFGIHEKLPGDRTSTIVVMGIRNKPGIQLPAGFRLIGIGGILGINRRADLDALKQLMSIGATGNILIADDPVRNAPIILGDLEFLFPFEEGVYVFGPTFRIVWLTGDLVQLDLALVIEYGSGSADASNQGLTKIVVFGTARAKKEVGGRKLVNLQIDILGVIDPAKRTFAFDGRLVNSKILDAFSATGSVAARIFTGSLSGSDIASPYAMFAVGGFHPRFNPEPARFEKMKRMALAYTGRGSDKIKVSAEAYMAFTVLTVQYGAKLRVLIKAGSVSAEGEVSYDVLLQYVPLYFDVALAAKIAIKYKSKTLAGVSFAGQISGPGPITLSGKFKFEILFFDFTWSDTFVIGNRADQTITAIASLLQVLAPALTDPANLIAEAVEDALVIANPNRLAHDRTVIAPNGQLVWSQQLSPLDCLIDRFGGVPLARPQAVTVRALNAASARPYREWFSPGAFADLDESEALNRTAFEKLNSGLVFGAAEQSAAPVGRNLSVNVFCLPRTQPNAVQPETRFPTLVLDGVDGRTAAADAFERRAAIIRARDGQWSVRGGDGTAVATDLSETDAHMRAKYGSAMAVRASDLIELKAI